MSDLDELLAFLFLKNIKIPRKFVFIFLIEFIIFILVCIIGMKLNGYI